MRLLHFSDLHLDTPFTWAGPDVGRTRRLALRRVLANICRLAEQESVDAVLCAGDLYEDTRFTPDTVAFVADTLSQLDMPVLLAPGNHDWYGPTSLYATASFAGNVHVFRSDVLEPYELAEGFTIWGAAHCAPANTDGFLDHFLVDRAGVNVALFHGSEQGALQWQESGKVPHAPFRAEQIIASGLNHAFVGHFHTPRYAERHTYPGNPEPLSFGEEGERGAVIAEVDEGGFVSLTPHEVSETRWHDIDVRLHDVDHLDQAVAQVQAAIAPLKGVVRATVHGEVGEDVDIRLEDLQALGSHLDAFAPRVGDIWIAYDLEDLAHEQTVRGEFIRMVRADSALDEEERRRVTITGLRALAGRSDLEVQ